MLDMYTTYHCWDDADFTVLAVQSVCVVAACNVEFRNCDAGTHALCRSGEVTPQRGGGWGKELRQKFIKGAVFPHLREMPGSYIFNSVDRKLLKADPRPTNETLSSSMSTCQQLSCLTSPLLGMLRSGYQTTVDVEQKQTNHQIIKPRPTIWFANGGVDPQHALSSYYFASNRDAIATHNAVTIATDLIYVVFFFFKKLLISVLHWARYFFPT